MNSIEKEIEKSRLELDKWLHESYGETYGDFYGEYDIGYEHWDQIEKTLKKAFEDENFESFTESCLDNILFLISRSNEGGRIIAWLSSKTNSPLSNISNLTVENFILLCNHALKSPDDYCDYQLANCFNKFDNLSDDQEKILIGFFNKKDIYTKRVSLTALAKHRASNLETYIVELWDTKDEWAGLDCLEALAISKCNDELFQKYKSELAGSPDEYIRDNAKRI